MKHNWWRTNMPTVYLRQPYEGYPMGCCALAYVEGFSSGHFIDIERTKLDVKLAIVTAKKEGKSMLLATLNDRQKQAEEVLLKMGFKAATEDYVYRTPQRSSNRAGVKLYIKQLYKPRKVN